MVRSPLHFHGRIPVPEVAPLTYRDGVTHLELVYELSQYLKNVLHPSLQSTVDQVVADAEQLLSDANAQYVDGVQEFQRIHDAFMSDVNASLIALNDGVVSDLVDDETSSLSKVLNSLFVTKTTVDDTVADHIKDSLSATHSAINYRVLEQIEAPLDDVRETIANIDLETPFQEFKTQDQELEGDWVWSRGKTGNNDSVKLVVERDFYESQGDLFDSKTQLMFTVRNQERTKHNPPGYSSAAIALVEDGANGEQYQGESARILFISNRFLFNQRLEVDMGGASRSTFVSGARDTHQFTELGFHNRANPRVTMFGPDNTARGGRKSKLRLDDLGLEVNAPSLLPHFEIRNPDANTGFKQLQIDLLKTGRTRIRHLSKGVESSTLYWSDNGDIEFTGRLYLHPSSLTLRSPDNTYWRIRVSNTGEIQAVRV